MRKIMCVVILMVVILFLLPIIVVNVATADAGLSLCLSLFFIVNPLASVACGIYSGLDIKKLWYLPIVFALIFLLSSSVIFAIGEFVFLVYSGAYLLIGYIAVLATYLIKLITNTSIPKNKSKK